MSPTLPATKPLVSVLMITYNQQAYIGQAVQSVVDQVTDFPFEIVLADDCSTDGTWDICTEIAARHPDIIRLIRPRHNLGINGNFQFALREARGEFIAICEGDDYWISVDKLQRQVEALNEHPEVDLAVSRGIAEFPSGELSRERWNHGPTRRILSAADFFSGYTMPAPSASLMWRATVTSQLPDWFDQAGFCDQIILLAATRRGGAFYDPDYSVGYRLSTPTSYTVAMGKLGIEQKIEVSRSGINALEDSVVYFDFPRTIIAHRINDARTHFINFLIDSHRYRLALKELTKLRPSIILKLALRNVRGLVLTRTR